MNAVFTAYQKVLGLKTSSEVAAIIDNLNQNKATSTFFTDSALTLETLAIGSEGGKYVRIGRAGRLGTNKLLPEPIAKGAVGEIYMSEDRTVIYKKIVVSGVQQQKEWVIRQTYMEAFIQTVLGLDPEYGRNICQITNLYRSSDLVRQGRSDKSGDMVLFIQMKPIANTLENVIDKITAGGEFKMSALSPYWTQLGTVLQGLKRKYNFSHRDLHTGNVMFQADGTLVLIDFGFSCMTVGGVTYSVLTENILPVGSKALVPGKVNAPCESYDILIYLTSFAQGYGLALEGSEQAKFVSLFDTRDKTFNLLNWIVEYQGEHTDEYGSWFHLSYPKAIESWPAEIREKLLVIPALKPDNFAAINMGFARDTRPRAGRRGRRTYRVRRGKKAKTQKNGSRRF
jgi:serine/threonine protein kinase